MVEPLGHDVRQALRSLTSHPRFSGATITMLAMGIALNAVVFAIVYGTLLRPLPYQDPDRLVRLFETHPGAASTVREPVLSDQTFTAWRAAPRVLEGLAGYAERAYTVGGIGDAERVRATAVSPELFELLRVRPAAGEFFDAAHANADADAVVVLSHEFWRDRFGAAADAIGRGLTLDGRRHLIIGIAPQGFSFPDRGRSLFTPLVPPQPDRTSPPERRPTRVVTAIGRLANGATLAQAAHEGTTIARSEPRAPSANVLFGEGGPVTVEALPLADHMTASTRPTLWLLAAGVLLILLVTCVNVAGLTLVRNVAREREFAIRAALGAERGHLVRQIGTEGFALSLAAGAIGTAIAWAALRALPAFAPASLPRLEDIRPDGPLLLYSLALSLFAGTAAVLLPALRSMRPSAITGLGQETTSSSGPAVMRSYAVLSVAEVALAAILIVGATLLTRSLVALMTFDTGYDASNVVTARITLQGSRDLPQRWQHVATAVAERLRSIDGVEQVGASNMAPFGDTNHLVGFYLPGDHPEPLIARTLSYVVTPGYIEALRISLRQGRLFAATDVGSGTQPVIVNDEFVRQYAGGRPAVGQQYFNSLAPNVLSEIVGVVGDVRKDAIDRPPQPELYVLSGHQGAITTGRQVNVVVQGRADLATVAQILRETVRSLDTAAAVHNVTRLDSQRSASIAQPRLAATVLAGFAIASGALAAAGLYSVLSYAASRRRRELAIRAALGATGGSLRWLIWRQGLLHAAAGLTIGLMLAAAGVGSLGSLLFNVAPLDAWSFVGAAGLLAGVTSAASLLAARRASHVDLGRSLRLE